MTYTLTMSKELGEWLQTVATESGLSKAEILQRSLRLYDVLREARANGQKAVLMRGDQHVAEIVGL